MAAAHPGVGAARTRSGEARFGTLRGFELLPDRFTLTELQLVHEAILGENLDKRNFRRKVIQKGIVKPTKEWQRKGRKPAQLYRFSQ